MRRQRTQALAGYHDEATRFQDLSGLSRAPCRICAVGGLRTTPNLRSDVRANGVIYVMMDYEGERIPNKGGHDVEGLSPVVGP
jgi:hypothetical protein